MENYLAINKMINCFSCSALSSDKGEELFRFHMKIQFTISVGWESMATIRAKRLSA